MGRAGWAVVDKVDELLKLPLNSDGEPYLCDVERVLEAKWQPGKGLVVKSDLVKIIRKMIKWIKLTYIS